MNKETVLVVEDHEINRKIVCAHLEKEYYVLEASNGEEALEMLDQHPQIGVMLLDLHMPVMDGFQVMEKLQDEKKTIPVIVMTAQNDTETEERALQCGALDFVSKPVNPHILVRRVHNAMIRNQMIILKQMEYLVSHDELTGIYNRSKLFSKTREMLDLYSNTTFAFIRFDIDKFRLYNSAMGENEGNKLLCYIAKLIEKTINSYEMGTYGRVDADVFCLCLPYTQEKILEHIARAQNIMSNYRDDYDIQTSFGIYVIDDNSLNMETIFTRASLATDECKNLYDINYAFYRDEMSDSIHEVQEITNDMKAALREEQFVVYLQPKYHIKTDQPCGAEALVRWVHPKKGMIKPNKFIPVFESNGFIADLDYYMWEHVCQLISGWIKNGDEVYPISVNMSRVSLLNPHVTELLLELIDRYEVPVNLFYLEVTESAYMSDPNLMARTMVQLHAAGFTVLMDDFGSGYSSLNTLKEIDIDILKLDMDFLSTGGDEAKSEKIISAIVRMAGWLGMDVIAEGVETLEQKQFLESIGCGYVQGYYYAKPMPIEEYEKLMRDNHAASLTTIKKEEYNSNSAVWSSNPMIEELISGIDFPVAIIEYAPNYAEIIRSNKAYVESYGNSSKSMTEGDVDSENVVLALKVFEEAVGVEHAVECNLSTIVQGKKKWTRMTVRKIAEIPKAFLLCCSLEDVTREMEYELRLNRIESILNDSSLKKKMLVIDDIEISREALRSLFKNDFEIIEAENGKQGLELLQKYQEDIEVILLDMVMPEMDGKEFLNEKNSGSETAEIPVIIISSEDDAATQIGMLQNGVNDYITKPFIPEITKQRVENVLAYKSRFNKLVKEYNKVEAKNE